METRVTIWGSFDGNVNVSYLTEACASGTARMKTLSKASASYLLIPAALEDAEPLLAEAEAANDPASGKTEAEKLAIQERIDDAAAGIFSLVTDSFSK
jgi:hypothetical protein